MYLELELFKIGMNNEAFNSTIEFSLAPEEIYSVRQFHEIELLD